mmetsp:Transcript_38591/g.32596  ORF Transcript_38591/g.32596 Transcript_38591/m.32596 type:complete len:121 (+) Transcript_38591:219-581(+)
MLKEQTEIDSNQIADYYSEINFECDRKSLAIAVNSLKRKRVVQTKTVRFAGEKYNVDSDSNIKQLDDDNLHEELKKLESKKAVSDIKKDKMQAIQGLKQLKLLSKNPEKDKEVTIMQKSN